MVQLNFLAGKLAGRRVVARRLPWVLGRGPECNFRLDDPGIWDRHLEFSLDESGRIRALLQPQACGILNGEPFQDQVLRNGDLIEIGAAKIQFWLSATRQRDFRAREWATWAALAALSLGQVALVYWLWAL